MWKLCQLKKWDKVDPLEPPTWVDVLVAIAIVLIIIGI